LGSAAALAATADEVVEVHVQTAEVHLFDQASGAVL
jgi:hypothetical protein